MIGPKPKGTWSKQTAANCGGDYGHLKTGARYVVVRAFEDYDGSMHSFGESWLFLGYCFNPHEDGLSLFVSLDGEQEWHIRMQCRPEAQGNVVDRFEDYLRVV